MIIGIDIDDVITDTSELMKVYAKKHFKSDDIDLINRILHGKRESDRIDSFYRKYLPEMMRNYKIKDNVKEVIDRLRLDGNKIIIITTRGLTKGLSQMKITKEYFKRHKIEVDKIIFKEREKVGACIKHKLDIMIDDSVFVLEKLNGTNTKQLLFSSISNKNYKHNFAKVSNWLELEQYITNLK